MLDDREFWDIEVAKSALQLVDRYELLTDVLKKPAYDGSRDVYCLMGEDLPGDNLNQCSVATTRYKTSKQSGYLATLGPSRMNYERIIPSLRYAKNLVQELVQ